jgi:molecular chaperone GrpE
LRIKPLRNKNQPVAKTVKFFMSAKKNQPAAASVEQLSAELAAVRQQLSDAQEQVLRAQADYQNLVRRQQDERQRLVALATHDLMSSLLQPLEHLELAAHQLNDPGLNMVIARLHQSLQEQGLEPIDPVDQPFDHTIMEAIEGSQENGTKVIKVHSKGYKLNGHVIKHAQVVVA